MLVCHWASLLSLNGSNTACVLVDAHVLHSCPLWKNGKFSLLGLYERCKIQKNLDHSIISVLAFIRCDRWQGALQSWQLKIKAPVLYVFFFFNPSNWASGHDVFLISTHYVLLPCLRCVGLCAHFYTGIRVSANSNTVSLGLYVSAELHIFRSMPSSHFYPSPLLRVIPSSGLVLGWLSNK